MRAASRGAAPPAGPPERHPAEIPAQATLRAGRRRLPAATGPEPAQRLRAGRAGADSVSASRPPDLLLSCCFLPARGAPGGAGPRSAALRRTYSHGAGKRSAPATTSARGFVRSRSRCLCDQGASPSSAQAAGPALSRDSGTVALRARIRRLQNAASGRIRPKGLRSEPTPKPEGEERDGLTVCASRRGRGRGDFFKVRLLPASRPGDQPAPSDAAANRPSGKSPRRYPLK